MAQIDNMRARRATFLPPSIMHDVELDRVIVGDGCGEAPLARLRGAVLLSLWFACSQIVGSSPWRGDGQCLCPAPDRPADPPLPWLCLCRSAQRLQDLQLRAGPVHVRGSMR